MAPALIVDTSGLLAFFDQAEPDHQAVRGVIEDHPGTLVVSPFVIAETDYLVATRHGVDAELRVLEELAGGAWELAAIGTGDLAACRQVVERFADQDIGVADASCVVLAQRYATTAVCTLDRRHFSVLRTDSEAPLIIVP